MDPKSITFGAVLGALALEIVKQIFSHFSKRAQDSYESKRKMLRQDIDDLVKLVCEILEMSIGYYATDFNTEKAKDLSRQIKAKSKTTGMKLTAANTQLFATGKEEVKVRLWIAFKSATTQYLDVTRKETWKDDDPRLNEIYKTASVLHSSLNKARYSNT
jgi:hypothetical protein